MGWWADPVPARGGSSPAPAPLSPIPAGSRVLFAGDSITQGWRNPPGTVDATYRWCAPFETQVAGEFNARGKTPPTFINTGVSGQTSTALLSDISNQIISKTPDRVFLLIGSNDVSFGLPYEATRDNIASIISTTRASLPSCLFYVISIWMIGELWPKGANVGSPPLSGDGPWDLRNAAIYDGLRTTLGTASQWIYVRDASFAYEAQYNVGNVASGGATQDQEHPTKAGTQAFGPLSGAELISQLVRAAVTLAL